MAGGRQKGTPKTGGRKPGSPNRIPHEKREILLKFINDKWEDFILAYDSIAKPEAKCSIMLGLLPFAYPRLAQIDYKEKTPPKTFQDELDELSGEKTRSK